jgi:hypothetical protein
MIVQKARFRSQVGTREVAFRLKSTISNPHLAKTLSGDEKSSGLG